MAALIEDLLINWGPMVILLGAWYFFAKRSGTADYKKHVDEMMAVSQEQLVELKAINENLTTLRARLEVLQHSANPANQLSER